jgi:hypothetical protein
MRLKESPFSAMLKPAMANILQRAYWNGPPEELRELFVLTNAKGNACTLRVVVPSIRLGVAT